MHLPDLLPAPAAAAKSRLFVAVVAATVIAELIGPRALPLGSARVVILPMLWALLLAALWSLAQRRLPAPLRIDTPLQVHAGRLLNAAMLLFVAKLGLMAGHALPQLRQAGWALFFQEFGHAFGTLALGLPLALALGLKREAVGATFSIGRENNLAIIAQKYGMRSPEGHGVMAEYITGTVLGAVFITLLASFVTSLGIFDPRSLAMGAGVGSGSLMAAAIGAINAQQPQALHPQLMAIAAASNLIAGVVGFYFALFLSLPLCNWLYARLEPVLGRLAPARQPQPSAEAAPAEAPAQALPLADSIYTWVLMIVAVTACNALSAGVPPLRTLPGMAVVIALVAIATVLKRWLPRLPLMLALSLLATAASVPGLWPFSAAVAELSDRVQFMSFTTPVLALAGFSIVKDLPAFRQLGWRIVLVSLTATAGTFLCATLIAEFFH
ncbi:DUF3100 domain-containing protein [Stenotrophomonas sp. MMGLT7]|uniref:DUF3100 domain-containing protein n=1 Tax=Stenotrophomonas sp. MMGLT7 TaxID=2901227 RepID=UPI001E3AE7AE|nr:DUF3100 domain-containing protein [Stenotrophomonas sp. MMGLT7]MCD7100045.1 DUF3100 domain-containing protein [Stenotrophomonas sp. MMGLT7]